MPQLKRRKPRCLTSIYGVAGTWPCDARHRLRSHPTDQCQACAAATPVPAPVLAKYKRAQEVRAKLVTLAITVALLSRWQRRYLVGEGSAPGNSMHCCDRFGEWEGVKTCVHDPKSRRMRRAEKRAGRKTSTMPSKKLITDPHPLYPCHRD